MELRFATIGTSWITDSFITSARETGRWELCAVFSRTAEKAQAFAVKSGSPEYYDDIAEMLGKSGADAVYIASPNSLHVEQTRLCLERGISVICEKPLSFRYGELRGLYEMAESKGLFLFEAYRHINNPAFTRLKDAVDTIKPVRSAVLTYNQYSSRYAAFLRGENPNVFNPEMGGGALADLGVYPVSLAAALFGKPVAVKAVLNKLSNGVDGAGCIIMDYTDFHAAVSFSKNSADAASNQICGENGTVVIDKSAELEKIVVAKRDGTSEDCSIKSPYENKLAAEADVFAEIILNSDFAKYNMLKEISLITCGVGEEAYRQN